MLTRTLRLTRVARALTGSPRFYSHIVVNFGALPTASAAPGHASGAAPAMMCFQVGTQRFLCFCLDWHGNTPQT